MVSLIFIAVLIIFPLHNLLGPFKLHEVVRSAPKCAVLRCIVPVLAQSDLAMQILTVYYDSEHSFCCSFVLMSFHDHELAICCVLCG